MAADGTITWLDELPGRYLYILEEGSSNPGVPPNFDMPDGVIWRDGSCLVDGGGVLSQFKASHLAPGGGGAGGRSDAATVGSDGSVTIRY